MSKRRPTSVYTRPLTARFFRDYAPTKALVGEVSLAGSAAGETRRYAGLYVERTGNVRTEARLVHISRDWSTRTEK